MTDLSSQLASLPVRDLSADDPALSAAAPPTDGDLLEDDLPEDELSRLMIRYQRGEIEAFEQLFKRLQPVLKRYLLTLTLNAAHADDLVQETFLQLHRSRQTFSAHRPARAWAFGIARHVFLMDRRASLRRHRREQEQAKGFEDLVPPKALTSFATRDRLQRAIANLNSDQREPLLLHHVWGFSFDEISGLLGIRSGTAKVRAHRAMRRLREILGEEDHA